jgi:hypothetical protein
MRHDQIEWNLPYLLRWRRRRRGLVGPAAAGGFVGLLGLFKMDGAPRQAPGKIKYVGLRQMQSDLDGPKNRRAA